MTASCNGPSSGLIISADSRGLVNQVCMTMPSPCRDCSASTIRNAENRPLPISEHFAPTLGVIQCRSATLVVGPVCAPVHGGRYSIKPIWGHFLTSFTAISSLSTPGQTRSGRKANPYRPIETCNGNPNFRPSGLPLPKCICKSFPSILFRPSQT